MHADPILDAVHQTLPRLLARYDVDRTNTSYGLGDRFHWAWGLIDFGNATFQGAAHGLARLWRSGLWPYETPREHFVERLDSLFRGAQTLTRRDGSLEEAFPYEGSYCVTALVAYDLLCAWELMKSDVDAATSARWLEIVAPMARFVTAGDEKHAFITNHLATAAAALARWHDASGDARCEARARELLQRILSHQGDEGWFDEYGGADPGYQTLATVYLADLHHLRPGWGLGEPLARSVRFLWHFAHPDGSFGGIYGSRCTRIYHPAGIDLIAAEVPEAAALARWMAHSIATERVVTLNSIDEPNLVPMFNSYCHAAALRLQRALPAGDGAADAPAGAVLPALRRESARRHFLAAGLLVDGGPRHYTVVSTHKGGVVVHFRDGKLARIDAGIVVRDERGNLGSTQGLAPQNAVQFEGDVVVVESRVTRMPKRLPAPWQFVLLRLGALTVMRWSWLRESVKQRLVRWLIAGGRGWPAHNRRRIALGHELEISDDTRLASGYALTPQCGPFVAIHMASQGYWQRQDEIPLP